MTSDVLTRTQLQAVLVAYIASLAQLQIALFTNNITPTKDTPYNAFTEPTATWYARSNTTFGTVFDDATGNMYAVAPSKQFQYSGTNNATVVYGWFIVGFGASNTTLYSSGLLASPVTLQTTLDAVIVQPVWILPPF
jgi:hypothetical protein